MRKLRTGVMPPPNMPQPPEADRLAILTRLEASLDAASRWIETQRAASMLTLFGVDSGQGYYWAKPLPMDDFIHYIGGCPDGKAKSA